MFAIRWSTYSGGPHEAICADNKSTWEVYWALKKSVERGSPPLDENYWIQIYANGVACNPEKGSALPFCREGEGPIFMLRKVGV